MGCRSENGTSVVLPVQKERCCPEKWQRKADVLCCTLQSCVHKLKAATVKGTTAESFFVCARVPSGGAGVAQIPAHSCVHTPAYRTVCPTRGIHFSFRYRWLCFHLINKGFLSNEIRLLYSSCLDSWSCREGKGRETPVWSYGFTHVQTFGRNGQKSHLLNVLEFSATHQSSHTHTHSSLWGHNSLPSSSLSPLTS